jgi:hypothetical protein
MSATDILSLFRSAMTKAAPAEESTQLPAVFVLIIVINLVASVCLMLSGIDLSAFVAM